MHDPPSHSREGAGLRRKRVGRAIAGAVVVLVAMAGMMLSPSMTTLARAEELRTEAAKLELALQPMADLVPDYSRQVYDMLNTGGVVRGQLNAIQSRTHEAGLWAEWSNMAANLAKDRAAEAKANAATAAANASGAWGASNEAKAAAQDAANKAHSAGLWAEWSNIAANQAKTNSATAAQQSTEGNVNAWEARKNTNALISRTSDLVTKSDSMLKQLPSLKSDVASVAGQATGIAGQVAGLATADQAIQADLAELETQMGGLKTQVNDMQAGFAAQLAGIAADIDALSLTGGVGDPAQMDALIAASEAIRLMAGNVLGEQCRPDIRHALNVETWEWCQETSQEAAAQADETRRAITDHRDRMAEGFDELREAVEAGDFDRAAEIQRLIDELRGLGVGLAEKLQTETDRLLTPPQTGVDGPLGGADGLGGAGAWRAALECVTTTLSGADGATCGSGGPTIQLAEGVSWSPMSTGCELLPKDNLEKLKALIGVAVLLMAIVTAWRSIMAGLSYGAPKGDT